LLVTAAGLPIGRGAATIWAGAGRAEDIGLTVAGWYIFTTLFLMLAAPGLDTLAIRYCGTGLLVMRCTSCGRGP